MIKVKAEAYYGFAGTDMEFEEVMKDMVMEQVYWSWEKE